VSTGIDPTKLRLGLTTKLLGKHIIFFQSVDSTNQYLKRLAEHGVEEGTVVLAETQKKGRGRLNRKWSSPEGGLYFSVLLKPQMQPKDATKLTLVFGLAVAEVLREDFSLPAELKWPNDVLIKGRKICGILVEASMVNNDLRFIVAGIGVNVNLIPTLTFSEAIKDSATSIQNEIGSEVSIEDFFRRVLEKMEFEYNLMLNGKETQVLARWRSLASFLGNSIDFSFCGKRIHGVALDISSQGELAVQLRNGNIVHFAFGEIANLDTLSVEKQKTPSQPRA